MQMEHAAAVLCDLTLATVFAASIFGKAGAMTDMRLEIAAHRLLPLRLVPAGAWALLAFEAWLAVAFAAGGRLEGVKEPAAIASLLVMSGLTWRRARQDASFDLGRCGCFGSHHPLGRRPLLRNGILVGVAAADWLLQRPAPSASGQLAFALAVAAAVLALEARRLRAETGAAGAGGAGTSAGGWRGGRPADGAARD